MPQERSKPSQLDRIDEAILDVVAVDGRIPVTELAKRGGL